MTDTSKPLVSIGMPVYNGEKYIRQALDSLLAQDYENFELIISDNASTDGTAEICQEYLARDKRISYYRNERNMGAAWNFRRVLELSSGEYFMWAGHDDMWEPSYISECLSTLKSHLDHSLVCGKPQYFKNGNFLSEGAKISLFQESAKDRVLTYFGCVADNGIFYGLMRRHQLKQVRMKRTMGGDWLLIAAIAFLGKIRTLEVTSIKREYAWTKQSFQKLASQEGLLGIQGRYPHLAIGLSVFKDIAWDSPVYKALRPIDRISLALRSLILIYRRFAVRDLRRKRV